RDDLVTAVQTCALPISEPVMMLKCHCRDCQQITGGGFAPAAVFPAKAFRLTKGKLRYHFTPSLAGGMHKRGFCAECGSRLTGARSEEHTSELQSPDHIV